MAKKLLIILMLILMIGTAYAVGLPERGENPFDKKLNDYLNTTLGENGTLKVGINASLFDLNVTDYLIANTANITNLNVSKSLFLGYLTGQSCIGTDSNGNITAGTCLGTTFNRGNITEFFGDSSFNSSVLRVGNITNIQNGNFNLGNLTNYFGDTSFNSSVLRIGNLTNLQIGNFNLANLTNYFGDSSFNSSVLRTSNITNIQNGNFNLANLTNFLGGTFDGNNSILRIGNISNIQNGAFNNANFTTQLSNVNYSYFNQSFGNTSYIYTKDAQAKVLIGTGINFSNTNLSEVLIILGNINVSGYINISGDFRSAGQIFMQGNVVQVEKDSFKLSNLTNYFGDSSFNSSVLRVGNITNIREGAYTLSNFTTNLGNRLSEFWNLLNLTNYFGDVSVNSSILRITNLSNILAPSWNRGNTSDYLGNQNGSILLAGNISTIFTSNNQSQWNQSFGNTTYFYPKESSFLVLIGSVNFSLVNLTDKFTIIGSASVIGSLNATFINATEIRKGANIVQEEGVAWKLSNLTNYFGDSSINSSMLRVSNITNIREGSYALSNFTTNLGNRLAEFFNLGNLTNYFGDGSFNSSVLRVGNITNIQNGAFTLSNFSTAIGGDNSSIIHISNLSTPTVSNVKMQVMQLNVTGGIGTTNITIGNGTTGISGRIYYNGSYTCISKCKP